jgi:hypothetical protein
VVVAVGLTVVEPLAEVDVNVPGVIARVAAPAVSQLSVLLEPEEMPLRSVVKEVIAGAKPFPEDELDELPVPQPVSTPQQYKTNAVAQRPAPEEWSLLKLSLFLLKVLAESMHPPLLADILTILARGWSVSSGLFDSCPNSERNAPNSLLWPKHLLIVRGG